MCGDRLKLYRGRTRGINNAVIGVCKKNTAEDQSKKELEAGLSECDMI